MSAVITLFTVSTMSAAQNLRARFQDQIQICPVAPDHTAPPADFAAPECQAISLNALDPQGRHLWVAITIDIPEALLAQPRPLGFFISGKQSTRLFIKGQRQGENGVPGDSPSAERPGAIDGVIFLDKSTLSAGENTLVLEISAQHGISRLAHPIQLMRITPYGDPKAMILSLYSASFLTLGGFILAALYFGGAAILGWQRTQSLTLCALSLIALAQLLLETSRGLIGYAYPFQDVRLIAILALSFIFTMIVLASVTVRFAPRHPWAGASIVIASGLLTLCAILLTPGFDGKTLIALIMPTSVAFGLCAWAGYRVHREGLILAATLGSFVALGLLTAGQFLDAYLYFMLLGVLAVLFILHARSLVREQALRRNEQARAHQLQIALDLAQESASPCYIDLSSTGELHRIPADSISHLSAAGDYVEIHLIEGRTLLHNGSLTKLGEALPASFLKIHRSHIVNTRIIEKLVRHDSGQGELSLSSGVRLPVSRRILPQVKKALHPQERAISQSGEI
ncbi:LytTR family DNA-binding domain-containing protein [Woodsholea maritima]|uniref:LytTR family DNA-binding domain-containing protein n=1 Tax=Woodsholea maritima TaxID=240237 RepID=UPI0014614B3E|nr:LytTR family DNA-binding domain-containing protein [Woodsholea maritima]